MAALFKREDRVLVIAGKAKDSQGKIVRLLKNRQAAIVEGVNRAKKHEKPNPKNEKGGIVDKEMPIHLSNLRLIHPKSGKPVKPVKKLNDKGKRIRVDSKTGDPID